MQPPKLDPKIEVEFNKIISRMVIEFPIDELELDWNKRIAPYLREIYQLFAERMVSKEKLKNTMDELVNDPPLESNERRRGYVQFFEDLLKALNLE